MGVAAAIVTAVAAIGSAVTGGVQQAQANKTAKTAIEDQRSRQSKLLQERKDATLLEQEAAKRDRLRQAQLTSQAAYGGRSSTLLSSGYSETAGSSLGTTKTLLGQ